MECDNQLHSEGIEQLCRICGCKSSKFDCKFDCSKFTYELLQCYAVDIGSDVPGKYPKFICKNCKRSVDKFRESCRNNGTNGNRIYQPKTRALLWGGVPCKVCAVFRIVKKGGRPIKRKASFASGGPGRPPKAKATCSLNSTSAQPEPACADIAEPGPSSTLPALPAEQAAVVSLLRTPGELHNIPEFDSLLARGIREKINKSKAGKTLDLGGTGGRHIKLKLVPSPSKSSQHASERVKKQRSKLIHTFREEVSGGDSFQQLQHELHYILNKDDLMKLLSDKLPKIPPNAGLDVKTLLCIPWEKLRSLRRLFNSWNIHIPCEGKDREKASELINTSHIDCRSIPLSHAVKKTDGSNHRTEIKLTPCCSVNLISLVTNHIQSHIKSGTLIHHSIIPDNEIWVKIGADKGGGSCKCTFQILNVNNPNSKENTVIFNMFEAQDSYSNLKQAMSTNIEHVNQLDGLEIVPGKICRVFLTGDYYGLSTFLGLSGASSVYFCFYCLIKKADRSLPACERHGPAPARTLDHTVTHHQKFVNSGSNLSCAKNYFNCINPPLFTIPIDRICPPVLHISLGIFLKIYKLLESACSQLDYMIYKFKSNTCSSSNFTNQSVNFAIYQQKLTSISQIESEIDNLNEEMTVASDLLLQTAISSSTESTEPEIVTALRTRLLQLETDITDKKKQVHNLKSKLPKNAGLTHQALDKALQLLNVKRQEHYSQSFVGNHVHKLCEESAIEELLQSVIQCAEEEAPEFTITTEAKRVVDKFRPVFAQFSKCHKGYSHSRLMSDEEIKKADDNIRCFMALFRYEFPSATITPKMHLLEDHVSSWLQKYKVGLGLFSEHGLEVSHSGMNYIAPCYDKIPDQQRKLLLKLQAHLLYVHPEQRCKRPQVKSRGTYKKK